VTKSNMGGSKYSNLMEISNGKEIKYNSVIFFLVIGVLFISFLNCYHLLRSFVGENGNGDGGH